jgi:hypothetical protein
VLFESDHIRREADIAEVARGFPDLDPSTVAGVHAHLTELYGEPPRRAELRDYVAEMSASLDEPRLRELLGLTAQLAPAPTPTPATNPAPADRPSAIVRHRGRPRGTRTASREEIVEAFWALRATTGRPPTQAQLAANLDPPVGPRTLQAWLREYGLGWPIG